MKEAYYVNARSDVDSIIPRLFGSVVELGAARLAFASRMLAKHQIDRYDYVEPVCVAGPLDSRLNRVAASVEQWLPGPEEYDFAIALDVLEHVLEPETAVSKIRRSLKPGGMFIISVPNLGHYSIVRRLLFGDFEYQDSGLLDRTHIRFFTPNSLDRLLSGSDFSKVNCKYRTRTGKFAHVCRSLRCYQYLSVWKKGD